MPVAMLSSSLITEPKRYGRFNALDTIIPNPGMILIKPTSINHLGTSASIGENGQVIFTDCSSLSINGVFSTEYTNYILVIRHKAAANSALSFFMRMRSSGTDDSSSNYTDQYLSASSTTIASARRTSQTSFDGLALSSNENQSGNTVFIHGPYLNEQTIFRTISSSGESGARIYEQVASHALSSSYDGFTFFTSTSTISGALQVYGVRS